jgi:prepilin-type N-terminal cleavage/methylation domain-containing protein
MERIARRQNARAGKLRRGLSAGFTLIELLIVIGILMALGVYQVESDLQKTQAGIATTTAKQLTTLLDAANAFSVNHYQEIIGVTAPSTPGLTCTGTSPARTCTATIASFQYDGLLPAGYTNVTAFSGGGSWNISYRILGTNPNYNVEGLVISSIPWTTDGSTNASKAAYAMIGMAARQIGSDGGGVGSPGGVPCAATSFCSSGGAFTLKPSDYATITTSGQIGGRVGTGTELFNAYLRRDGTLPMTGNLNMGGNSIYNVVNITGTGNVAMAGSIEAAGAAGANLFNVDTNGKIYGNELDIGSGIYGTSPAAQLVVNGTLDSQPAGKAVLSVNGSVMTPTINNAGGGVVIGAQKTNYPWGNGGSNYSTNGALSVDDIYIRSIGHWASEVASQYANRGVYLVGDLNTVPKPTCQTPGQPAGTPRIVVTGGDQIINVYLQQGPAVSTGAGTLTLPAQEAVGEVSDYAIDNGTFWTVRVTTTSSSGGAPISGRFGLAQVYCEYVFKPEQ